MKHVNKYKIKRPGEDVGSLSINLSVSDSKSLAGQSELIDNKFVDIEVENSINSVIDYESAKFIPLNPLDSNIKINDINYKLNYYNNSLNYYSTTNWIDLGFSNSDIQNQKNSFTKSFLRLSFYDSDVNTKQKLLFFVTLYPKLDNITSDPSNKEVIFKLGDTLIDSSKRGEGFFLYYFKDEVLPTVNKETYMRATFYNAKTGKSTNFMSTNNTYTVSQLIAPNSGKLYTKYNLSRNIYGYNYSIDNLSYSNNVNYSTTSTIDISLYQIKVV